MTSITTENEMLDEKEIDSPFPKLTAREKRDLQKSQLRPLANRRPELYEEDEFTSEEYEKMMELYNGTLASIEEGEIVKSTVLEIRENLVVLDIGFKSEGTIPLEEFKDMPELKVGDEVEVLLEHLEDQEGSVVLSKKKADFMRVWERIRVAYENDEPVEGSLVKKIKGGVVVDLMGVDAFLPGSQIALRRVPNIDELLGVPPRTVSPSRGLKANPERRGSSARIAPCLFNWRRGLITLSGREELL